MPRHQNRNHPLADCHPIDPSVHLRDMNQRDAEYLERTANEAAKNTPHNLGESNHQKTRLSLGRISSASRLLSINITDAGRIICPECVTVDSSIWRTREPLEATSKRKTTLPVSCDTDEQHRLNLGNRCCKSTFLA